MARLGSDDGWLPTGGPPRLPTCLLRPSYHRRRTRRSGLGLSGWLEALAATVETLDRVHSGPIDQVLVDEPLTTADAVVAVTRNAELDLDLLPPADQRTGYIGLMER